MSFITGSNTTPGAPPSLFDSLTQPSMLIRGGSATRLAVSEAPEENIESGNEVPESVEPSLEGRFIANGEFVSEVGD